MGRLDHIRPGIGDRSECSVPGPLQTVQRAELREVLLAIQARNAVHVGVDNIDVVRHVGRICDKVDLIKPFMLMDDGDWKRRRYNSGHEKVKGHADAEMVLFGQVKKMTVWVTSRMVRLLTRRRVDPVVIDAQRNLSGVCCRWYPVVLLLHWFLLREHARSKL